MVRQAHRPKEPAFADSSHLALPFCKPTGPPPHEFRAQRSLIGHHLVSACGEVRLHGRREQTLQILHNAPEAVGAESADIGAAQWPWYASGSRSRRGPRFGSARVEEAR